MHRTLATLSLAALASCSAAQIAADTAHAQAACRSPDTAVVELVVGLVPTVGQTLDDAAAAFCARIASVAVQVPVVPAGAVPPVTVTP
jgi:hypothetical protein